MVVTESAESERARRRGPVPGRTFAPVPPHSSTTGASAASPAASSSESHSEQQQASPWSRKSTISSLVSIVTLNAVSGCRLCHRWHPLWIAGVWEDSQPVGIHLRARIRSFRCSPGLRVDCHANRTAQPVGRVPRQSVRQQHKLGRDGRDTSPMPGAPLAEAGRRPGSYKPTLSRVAPGQHRSSERVFFPRIRTKSPDRAKNRSLEPLPRLEPTRQRPSTARA